MNAMHESTEPDSDLPRTHSVTNFLEAVAREEEGAFDSLLELVIDELRRLARRQLAREPGANTLQPTSLVNEAYLRLFDDTKVSFANRRHFFGAAAIAMHRICVDSARKRRSAKRGGGIDTQALADDPPCFDRDPLQVLAVDEALNRLSEHDPELVEIVRLRYFVDLSLEDTAEVLGISRRTVASRWRLARAWLFDALREFRPPLSAE